MSYVMIAEETIIPGTLNQPLSRQGVGPRESLLAETVVKCAISFAIGATLAAAATFLLDPVRGKARQARIRDKAMSLEHRAVRGMGRRLRNAKNHARGIVAHSVPGAAAMMRKRSARSARASREERSAMPAVPPQPLDIEAVRPGQSS